MKPHNPHQEIYQVHKEDALWTLDFTIPKDVYEHFKTIIEKQLAEQKLEISFERELINRVTKSMWKEIENDFSKSGFTLIRNDLMHHELHEDAFRFTIRLLFLREFDNQIAKEYPYEYDFNFLEDLKPEKNLLTRNILLIGHKLPYLEDPRAPEKVDRVGRHLKVNLAFYTHEGKLKSEQDVELFIVGLGLLDNNEFQSLKGKKPGDVITFKQRRLYFGWDAHNQNFRDDGSFVQLKILSILNTSWRSKIKDLLLEEQFRKTFSDEIAVQQFIANVAKFEMRLQDNFNFCYDFVDYLIHHPSTQVSKEVKAALNEGYQGSLRLVEAKPELKNQLKPELKTYKDEADFLTKALTLEVDPLKVTAFSKDVFSDLQKQRTFFEKIRANLEFYFEMHLEVIQREQILLTTYMNYITILQFMKVRNNTNGQYFEEEMFNFDLKATIKNSDFLKSEKTMNEETKVKN